MIRAFTTLLIFVAWSHFDLQAQQLGIGEWREHIPYNNANSVAIGDGLVYCGSEAAFTTYNPSTYEINRYSTINGLSDIGIQLLEFNDYTKTLLVAYKNGNIDLVEGNTITNIASIKDADIIADKSIYNIRFDDSLAYLSCGFGIVVLDVDRKEIKDTYNPDSSILKVNDVYIEASSNRLIAATDKGIYSGNLDKNLSDFNNWTKDTLLPSVKFSLVEAYAGYILYNYQTSTYDSDIIYGTQDEVVRIMHELKGKGNNHFQVDDGYLTISKYYNVMRFDNTLTQVDLVYTYDANENSLSTPSETIYDDGKYWIADKSFGLVEYYYAGSSEFHTPNGPNTTNISHLDIINGGVWSTSGILVPSYHVSGNPPEFNQYQNLTWTGKDRSNEPIFDSVAGYIKIKVNPLDNSQVFSGSWGDGLMEFKNGEVVASYDHTNTEIHSLSTIVDGDTIAGNETVIRVGGLDFDRDGNLWISNSNVTNALSIMQPSTQAWQNFSLSAFVDDQTVIGDVLVADNGDKWVILNRNAEIVVYRDQGTISNTLDDHYVALTTSEGHGTIPGGLIHTMAKDKNGNIWIGTDEGPAVFYNPSSAIDANGDYGGLQAQRIFVQQDGQTQILLETENIRAIAIDGADRKWFGSTSSGVYLMSQDATQEISHFTSQNSPLFSDDIKFIDIDGVSGEVYFCTSEGLISYRGTATDGEDDFGNVEVFPNPVKQGYTGVIAIRGLAENANVKITDINGVLAYETYAQGGQATWDGRSLTGKKAKNGVYLIFSTNSSGESQNVSKVLVLNN